MNNFYNFDVIIDRLNTFSAKWNVDNDIIPMLRIWIFQPLR